MYYTKNANVQLHSCSFRELCHVLNTSATRGLSSRKARKRLNAYGPNQFTVPKNRAKLNKYIRDCFMGFGLIIFLSSILCLIYYNYQHELQDSPDCSYLVAGLLLIFIFFFSGALRFLQSNQDHHVGSAFSSLLPKYCTVLRDGKRRLLLVRELVIGDVVLLNAGHRVPADMRIFQCEELKINAIALTGISRPMSIHWRLKHPDIHLAGNIVFAGTHVIDGQGQGIVIACGDQTLAGGMAQLSMEKRPRTRVRKYIVQLTFVTLGVAIFLTICLYAIVELSELSVALTFEFIIGLAIASTPLYLQLLIFVGLKLARRRLRRKNCYIKNLEAGCTLGLTTVICSDMVGTMTLNNMRVSEYYCNAELHAVEDLAALGLTERFKELIRVAVLCNQAMYAPGTAAESISNKLLSGNEYDIAMLKLGLSMIEDADVLLRHNPLVSKWPYTNFDTLHVTIHKTLNDKNVLIYVMLIKGNYLKVLERCTTYALYDEELPLNAQLRSSIYDMVAQLNKAGREVFAFGYKELIDFDLKSHSEDLFYDVQAFYSLNMLNLRFLGLLALYDPPRENICDAVTQCRLAGIKLILITRKAAHVARAVAVESGVFGKNNETVADVAARLRISESEVKPKFITAAVVNLEDMCKLEPRCLHLELSQLLLSKADLVFAGATLEQRLLIVQICQQLGAQVTVIGSNVYDTPALRNANVGVAKGISACSTARHCADIVLMDDDLATLVVAIKESRLYFENLKKTFAYALPTVVPQFLALFAFLLVKIPITIYIQISFFIQILICAIPALTLIFEKPEEDLLSHRPKVHDDYIINRRIVFVALFQVGIIEASAALLSYFVVMGHHGFLPKTLIGLHCKWYEPSINDLTDSYGQEWTYAARKHLELWATTSFFLAIIILQAFNLIIVRTARASILKHGFGNYYLTLAALGLIFLGLLLSLIDIPKFTRIIAIESFDFFWYLVPFVILLLLCEYIRRFLLRRFPGGWLEQETHY